MFLPQCFNSFFVESQNQGNKGKVDDFKENNIHSQFRNDCPHQRNTLEENKTSKCSKIEGHYTVKRGLILFIFFLLLTWFAEKNNSMLLF